MKGKSDKAFSKNVAAEMHAGKPQGQALAIAYSVKRKALKKKAHGGMVDCYAKGGEVHPAEPMRHPELHEAYMGHEMDPETAKSIAEMVIKKHMMARGGLVEHHLMEPEDHMSMDQMNYENMGEDDIMSHDHEMINNSETDMDAGQHEDMQPEKKQRLASIMAKVRMRQMGI